MKKETRNTIIKIAVSTILFYIIYRQNNSNFSMVIANFGKFNFWYAPLVLFFIVLNYVIGAFRWKTLLVFENTKEVKVTELIGLYFKGAFFNNFMPTSIGGDVYKVVGLNQKIKNLSHSFASAFMDRFTGVVVLMLIALLSFPIALFKYDFFSEFIGIDITSMQAVGIALGFLILFVIGMFVGLKLLDLLAQKVEKLQKVNMALQEYVGSPKVVAKALGLSVLVQLVAIFTQYFVFMGLGVNIPVFFALMIFPIIALITFLPISLNGYGVQDGLYKYAFSFVGIADPISLSASLFYHISRLIISLIGGVLYAFEKNKINK